MKLVLLFGPPAVGKMSVGRELENLTGLKLFHSHATIEAVAPVFDFGTPPFDRLVRLFRHEIFKEAAKSDLKGLIFAFVWAFDLKSEEDYINNIVKIFTDQGAEIYYVELEADLKERLRRNKTVERLKYKPTKRNVKESEKRLLENEEKHRFNTKKNELQRKNYLRIDNTTLTAKEAAQKIFKEFNL